MWIWEERAGWYTRESGGGGQSDGGGKGVGDVLWEKQIDGWKNDEIQGKRDKKSKGRW